MDRPPPTTSPPGELAPVTALVRRRWAAGRVPVLVAVTGCVAAGKSTVAVALAGALAAPPKPLRVEVVNGDGFLHPNAELDRRGLGSRKGFPETYDLVRLAAVLAALAGGADEVAVPVYSHERYDVLGDTRVLVRPDVVIVEGLHLLHPSLGAGFDVSVYLDADDAVLEEWYVSRFVGLCQAAAGDPTSFYHRFDGMVAAEIAATARFVWESINGPNGREHIVPTRARADVVIGQEPDHTIRSVRITG